VAISTRKFLWSWQCPKGDNGATNLRAMRRHTGVVTILVIIALLILPNLAFTVLADEEADATLEVRAISASFSADEMVTLTWRNINTTEAVLLDALHAATYQVERFAMNETTIEQLTTISSGIAACDGGDNNAACSAKNHSLSWAPPEGTDGDFFYRITTHQSSGSTTTFTPGLSQTENPQSEFASPHWGPVNVSATYNSQSQSTTIGWDNLPDSGIDHQIWIWRHSEPANRDNWDSISKSTTTVLFTPTSSSYIKNIEAGVERSVYYSVTYDNGTFSDTRFLRDNTMTAPVYEDTIAPELISHLTADHDVESGITSLSWVSGAIESGLSTNIWRAPRPITDLGENTVVNIATIEGQLTNYDHVVREGELGNFWYALTLEDSVGNQISTILPQHPNAGPIFESTVGAANATAPTNVSAVQSLGMMTTVAWEDVAIVTNAIYHIWAAYDGAVTQAMLDEGNATYLGNVSAGIMSFNSPIPEGIEREIWYAVTVEGAWGGAVATYDNRLIISGQNSMITPLAEDNLVPPQVTDFTATFDGPSTTISLLWEDVPAAQTYQLWMLTGIGLLGPWWNVSEDSGWVLIETYNATGGEISTSMVHAANQGQYAYLALVTADAAGNIDHHLYGEGPVEAVALDSSPPQGIFSVFVNQTQVRTSTGSNGSIINLGEFADGDEVSVRISSYEYISETSSRVAGTTTWQTHNISTLGASLSLPGSNGGQSLHHSLEVMLVDDNNNPSTFTLNYSWVIAQTEEECPPPEDYCDQVCSAQTLDGLPVGCSPPPCDCEVISMGGASDYIFPGIAFAILAFVIISTMVAGRTTEDEEKVYEEE